MNPIVRKTHRLLASAAVVAVLAALIGTSDAVPVTVANFSFESPDITGANITAVPTDWTAPNGTTGVGYRDDYAGLANAGIPDGNQWAKITFTGSNKGVTLVQDTGVTLVEGVTYTLTVAVGEQDNFATVDNIARIFLYGSTSGSAAPFALLDNIDPIPDANITVDDDSIWIDCQIRFTATAAQAGESLVIGLGAGGNIGNDGGAFNTNVNFDNVRLEAETIPAGSPVIYEPFNYLSTGITGNDGFYLGDGNQSGGSGLAGSWSQIVNSIEMEVWSPGMTFTDAGGKVLPVSGNSARRSNRAGTSVLSRPLSAAATTALTADNTTMWMSFLYMDEGFSGPDSSVMLASEPLASSANHALGAAGYGVGILIGETAQDTGATVEAGYYLNSTATTRAQSTLNPNDSEGTVFLLAAKINWKPDGTPDELFVFNITDMASEPSEANAIASITFDMPLSAQQSLDTLNIGETQVDAFDEIRFGTRFADVVGLIHPAGSTPAITSFTSVGGGVWEVELSGVAGGEYVFYSDPDLIFDPGALIENLVQGANGTVGGTNNTVLTLDGSGLGVVRMTLSGNPRDFIRAQTAPQE